jgi:WD40 repeat protein
LINVVTSYLGGRRAISGSCDFTLKIWDLDREVELSTLRGHTDELTGVAVDAANSLAVSVSHEHSVVLWDLNRLEKVVASFTADAPLLVLSQ